MKETLTMSDVPQISIPVSAVGDALPPDVPDVAMPTFTDVEAPVEPDYGQRERDVIAYLKAWVKRLIATGLE